MIKTIKGPRIDIRNLTVVYDRKEITAVKDLSLSVNPGEFFCFVGTTGCGKSTILNTIAGFVKPTSGKVLVNKKIVDEPGPKRGMVFQQHALFPWLTVYGNIQFGPLSTGKNKREAKQAAEKYIELVGLQGFENSYPNELSGGMQQRVGLARALANDPHLLLMDEPFGSLDAQTRITMQELLLDIWAGTGKTVIFVTHDVEEAVFLADRIIVLTARPAQVKKEVIVSLARPRKYDIMTTAKYTNIKKEVFTAIREETLRVGDNSKLN
jgi:NitT/TauT family transport system ATP-binding protein